MPTKKKELQTSDDLHALPEPLVISRSEHPISRNDLDSDALKVLYRLKDAGYKAYLVGGGVRDIYLGKKPKDFDISTSATPGQVRKLFRNSRIIGRRFRLVQVFFGANKIIELSTFRQRSEYDVNGEPDAVLPANNTFGTPAEDAFRRDLTINAIFYDIEDFSVIDYTGGVEDLKNKIVRIVGDPDRRITRDPVRMMRVIRHAARASFEIEPQTWEAICAHHTKLSLCPVSRIRDEFFKDLRGGASKQWAELACASGLFPVILPFYKNVLDKKITVDGSEDLFGDILAVTDRLLTLEYSMSDGLLLTILLVPWAISEMELMSVCNQKESYGVSRKIRERLQQDFSHLNIKRSMQDEIARCIATLPLLLSLNKSSTWPNWLRKKSYFGKGLELFKVFREATGAEVIDVVPAVATTPTKSQESADSKPPQRSPKRAPRVGGRSPAFAPGESGGVFGFRSN